MWVTPLKGTKSEIGPPAMPGGTPIAVSVGGFPLIFVNFRKN